MFSCEYLEVVCFNDNSTNKQQLQNMVTYLILFVVLQNFKIKHDISLILYQRILPHNQIFFLIHGMYKVTLQHIQSCGNFNKVHINKVGLAKRVRFDRPSQQLGSSTTWPISGLAQPEIEGPMSNGTLRGQVGYLATPTVRKLKKHMYLIIHNNHFQILASISIIITS